LEEWRKQLTVLLHDLQELDDNLGGWSDQDLTLSTLLSVGNSLEDIGEHRHLGHLQGKRADQKQIKQDQKE
jgi:hypothetical protein